MQTIRLLFILLTLHSQNANAWGPMGHELIGELAEPLLKPMTKSKIEQILGSESMAHATTYLDRMRGSKEAFWRKTASPWHYVTVPDNENYQVSKHAPTKGDAYTALMRYSKQLAQSNDIAEQKLALYFVLHLVGDIHQPLHAGNGKDRGGNNFTVYYKNKRTNIHRLWDSQMLSSKKHSYWLNKLSTKVSALPPHTKQVWQSTSASDWINESIVLRQTLYPAAEKQHIESRYIESSLTITEQRLIQAAVRLAHQLNILLAD